MWWTVVVIAALTGGLIDFCIEQLELPEDDIQVHDAVNQLDSSNAVWDTERVEFAPNPDPPSDTAGALAFVSRSSGARLSASPGPNPRWESLNFEFRAGSPSGWAAYVDPENVVDCVAGEVVILPGDTVLVVHFDGAFRQDSYFEYDVSGSSVILDARQICDENGVIEWAIGVSGIRDFSVDTRPLELSTVNVNVAY